MLFGVTITGLVIYAVSSELFASNSPTKLYEEAVEIVQNDAEVNSVLLQPIRFHAESSGGRRNRRVRSSLSLDRSTGKEKMTIHFSCEGKSLDRDDSESWTEKAKRWIRPIVVDRSDASDLIPSQATPIQLSLDIEANSEIPESSSWLGSIFGSLLPSAFANRGSGLIETHTERMKAKPLPGAFSRGEAIATLLMDEKGKFQLESLVVFYPGRPSRINRQQALRIL